MSQPALSLKNTSCLICHVADTTHTDGMCMRCNAALHHLTPTLREGPCPVCQRETFLFRSDYKPREWSACFRHVIIATAREMSEVDYSHIGDPRNIAN